MYAAIDVAAAKVLRQLRKYKTRVLEHRKDADVAAIMPTGASLDEIMADLSADEEVEASTRRHDSGNEIGRAHV